MSYQVLARRFRPQTFSSIVGQEQVTKALANAILLDRVPHAVVLTGPRGTGKTTSARVFARALNCAGREIPKYADIPSGADPVLLVEPCGECANCKEIARSANLAVWEVDGASNNSVDNVRDLIDSLRSVPPPGSRYKIYIIDEVHMLSIAAFNALLKSLEEPPPNTVFIFATTEPHKIPDTVLSRCQRHDFRRLPIPVMVESLRQISAAENAEVDDEVLEFIASKARGGMRDAQSMLDRLVAFSSGKITPETASQLLGVVDSGFYLRLSEAVFAARLDETFSLLDEAFTQSIDVRTFVADFLRHWRNLLMVKLLSSTQNGASVLRRVLELSQAELKKLSEQVQEKEAFDIQRLFDIAEQTARNAVTSAFPRYVLEAGVAKMATLSSLLPLGELLARLPEGSGTGVPSSMRSSSPGKRAESAARPELAVSPEASRPATAPVRVVSEPAPTQQSAARAPSGPAPLPHQPEERLAEAISWEGFLGFLKDARSELVLAAYLRRVSPKLFVRGRLVIEAGPFDFGSLSEPASINSLKDNLAAFSSQPNWDVRVLPLSEVPTASVAVKEKEQEQNRKMRLEAEARRDPLVQAALSVFEGSAIERIIPGMAEPDEK